MDSLYKRNSIAEFFATNFKWLVIAGIAIAAFMLIKGCGNGKEREALQKLQAANDTLQVNLIASEREVRVLNYDKEQLVNELDETKEALQLASSALNKTKDLNSKLAGRVIKSKLIHDTVSYIVACDSLAELNERYKEEVEAFSNYATALQNECDSLAELNSKIIKELDMRIGFLSKTLDLANKVIPIIKRRTELYGGAIIFGNESQPFYGFTGNIGLLTKKGAMIIAGYGILNKEKYYSVGYLGRLSFRKH